MSIHVLLFAAAVAVLGLVGYAVTNNSANADNMDTAADVTAEAVAEPAPLPRENAVLVFGASGKMGRKIVEKVGNLIGSPTV